MSMTRRRLILSGATLASGAIMTSAIAQNTEVPPPSPPIVHGPLDTKPLSALIDKTVSAHNSPGISLSVWKAGTEIFSHVAGMANLETGTRVTKASVFRIGSLSKQFAGALILKLAASGKLSLSDPARDYLPFLSRHDTFTLLELLNHTAGVHDGDYDGSSAPQQPSTHPQIDLAQKIAQQDPFFDFPPGTAWLYSNANYILIGAIVEQVTGKPLAEAASSLLFDPLGLHHTAFDTPGEIVTNRVSGYTPTDLPKQPFQNADYLDVSLAGAAGAMRSTASDLCRWHHALFSGHVVPLSMTANMTMPARLRNGQLASTNRFSENDKPMGDTQYGLGLMLDNATKDHSLIVNHHGGINGFAAYLATHVSSGLSFACLCNVDTHPGLPFRDIRRKIFAEFI